MPTRPLKIPTPARKPTTPRDELPPPSRCCSRANTPFRDGQNEAHIAHVHQGDPEGQQVELLASPQGTPQADHLSQQDWPTGTQFTRPRTASERSVEDINLFLKSCVTTLPEGLRDKARAAAGKFIAALQSDSAAPPSSTGFHPPESDRRSSNCSHPRSSSGYYPQSSNGFYPRAFSN